MTAFSTRVLRAPRELHEGTMSQIPRCGHTTHHYEFDRRQWQTSKPLTVGLLLESGSS